MLEKRTTKDALLLRVPAILIGLLLTGGAVAAVGQLVAVTYSSSASGLLIPTTGAITQGSNPFLYLGGLAQARDVLILSMSSDESKERFLGDSPDADYVVSAQGSTPLVAVRAFTTDPNEVAVLRDAVFADVPVVLEELQDRAGAPDNARIAWMPLSKESEVVADTKQQRRAMLAVAGVGLAATAILVMVLDRSQIWRRGRKRQETAPVAATKEPHEFSSADREPDGRPEPSPLVLSGHD